MGCICSSSKKRNAYQNTQSNSANGPLMENIGHQSNLFPQNQINPKNLINNQLVYNQKNDFINNFFNKNLEINGIEKNNSIFIQSLNKKMIISKDSLNIEEDLILKVNLDTKNSFYKNFSILLDDKVNNILSKEIYIDDIRVDDSRFKVNDYSIKLEFENTYDK